jgi:hypothetical protein
MALAHERSKTPTEAPITALIIFVSLDRKVKEVWGIQSQVQMEKGDRRKTRDFKKDAILMF